MKKVKSLINIAIIILSIILLLNLFNKFNILPGLTRYFFPGDSGTLETQFVVQEVKKISELFTQAYYDEIFFDTGVIKTGLLKKDKRLAVIAQGIVKAGFDLSRFNEDRIQISGKKIIILLPPPKILSVTSNPSQNEVFIAEGKITQDEENHINMLTRSKLLENAIRKRILERSEIQGKKIVSKLMKLIGYEEVVVEVEDSENVIAGDKLITAALREKHRFDPDLKSVIRRAKIRYFMDTNQNVQSFFLVDKIKYPGKRYSMMSDSTGNIIFEYKNDGAKDQVVMRNLSEKAAKDLIANQDVFEILQEINRVKLGDTYFLENVRLMGKTYSSVYCFLGDRDWVKVLINKQNNVIEIIEKQGWLNNQKELCDIFFSNPHNFSGVLYPTHAEVYFRNNKLFEYDIVNVKFNPDIPESFFSLTGQ